MRTLVALFAILLIASSAIAQDRWFEIESEGVRMGVDRDGWVLLGARRSDMRFHQNRLTIDGRPILTVAPNGEIQKRSGEVVAQLLPNGDARRGPGRFVFEADGALVAHAPDGTRHPQDYRLHGASTPEAKRAAMVIVLVFALGLEAPQGPPAAPVPGR